MRTTGTMQANKCFTNQTIYSNILKWEVTKGYIKFDNTVESVLYRTEFMIKSVWENGWRLAQTSKFNVNVSFTHARTRAYTYSIPRTHPHPPPEKKMLALSGTHSLKATYQKSPGLRTFQVSAFQSTLRIYANKQRAKERSVSILTTHKKKTSMKEGRIKKNRTY